MKIKILFLIFFISLSLNLHSKELIDEIKFIKI